MKKRRPVGRLQGRGDAAEPVRGVAHLPEADGRGLAAEEEASMGGIDTAQPGSRRAQKPLVSARRRLASSRWETADAMWQQFQFRNLSGDPRLNLRLKGILTPQ